MKAEAFAEVKDVMSVRVACRETDMEEGRRLESGELVLEKKLDGG